MLRRTRWRLVLWSAGSTLLVLLVLGTILYAAVARLLVSDSETQLIRRARVIATVRSLAPNLLGPNLLVPGDGRARILPFAPDAAAPGFLFGGPGSGTIAFIVDASMLSEAVRGPDPDAL
jgi:hypothetical protein